MATDIKDKGELVSLASKLDMGVIDLSKDIDSLQKDLNSISNYDGIDVSSVAKIISTNLNNCYDDLSVISKNINNYALLMNDIDTDDFSSVPTKSNVVDYEDIFDTDGSHYSNARAIWNFLKYKGLSDAAIAGVLGNIQAESGFNPSVQEYSNGEGYGLIQWSFGRRDALEDAALEQGVDVSDLQFQLEYLWNEALDPNTSYGKSLAAAGFYTTNSVSDAAYYFHKYVENSADSQTAIQNNRCATAEAWYKEFRGSNPLVVSGAQESDGEWVATLAKAVPAITTTKAITSTRSSYTDSSSNVYYVSNLNKSNNVMIPSNEVQHNIETSKVTITSGDPNIDISKYRNNLQKGFEVTIGNLAYKMSEKDIELLCAIVAAESDKSYDDALAVITTILNRCEAPNWINSYGTNPIAQATAPNQFVVYQYGSYKAYMNGKAPNTVVEAVRDALAGLRNHEYLSFRSNGSTGYSNNMISPTGNRYK